MKRAADILLALAGLILLAPLGAIVALLIKLDSRGPVFFRLRCAGRNGVPFDELKFRTMIDGAIRVGAGRETFAGDPRITRVGRWLRVTSIDELPQLWNVLKGEMSIVGPRPTFAEVAAAYDERERGRLAVRPGLTGLAQVRGRNTLAWAERIELDLEYVARHGMRLDWQILLATPRALFSGIYGPGGHNRAHRTPPHDPAAYNRPGDALPGRNACSTRTPHRR